MNPLGLKAGILGAAAFVLLVPTFNALNAAHFDEVDPPFNLEPPDDPPDLDDPPLGDQPLDVSGVPPPGSAGSCEEYDLKEEELFQQPFEASPASAIGPGGQGGPRVVELPPNVVSLLVVVGFESYVGHFVITISDPAGAVQNGAEDQTLASPTDGPQTWQKEYPFGGPTPGKWTIEWRSDQEVAGRGFLAAGMQTAECKTPGASA